jgi:four helix bundle protein
VNNDQLMAGAKRDKGYPLKEKSYAFAVWVVRLYRYLCDEKHEYVLSKQVLRSGTSIGAISKSDFSAMMSIAYKEAFSKPRFI